jgi:sec-independent protein translocase protein TatC
MPETLSEAPSTEKDPLPAMGFLEHLEELRRRIIYSLIAMVVGFFACWGYAEKIYDFVQAPIMTALRKNGLEQKLVYLNPTDGFNLYIKTAFVAGLFLTSPFVLYQVWAFIAPGLYRREKKYVVPFMVFTVLLFLSGGAFGYKIVFPAALEFLISYSKQFQPMITISEYTDLFLAIIVGLGVIFEMPILVFFLSLMGIVSASWMWPSALLDSRNLHRGDFDADHRHPEHVSLRGSHGRTLRFIYRSCLVGASQAAPGAARTAG